MGTLVRRAVFIVLLTLSGCSSLTLPGDPIEAAAREEASIDLAATLGSMRPFSFGTPIATPEWEAAAWRYYGLDHPVPHRFGSLIAPLGDTSPGIPIATHVYETPDARATIFLVHGYYDHVGIHARTIGEWIQAGYTVVTFDLPGHGLSGGERAAIADFADYASAFTTVIETCRGEVPEPWVTVAHSTGCAVVLERWMTEGVAPFERTVFVGPLVRSAYWGLSKFGSVVVGVFTDEVARTPRRDSSDQEFLRFRTELDPLQFNSFPLDWFDALRAWYARFAKTPPIDAKLLVFQGDLDDTVSWRHNLKKLKEKVPGVEVKIIAGGRHQLLAETPEFRTPVIEGEIGRASCRERV